MNLSPRSDLTSVASGRHLREAVPWAWALLLTVLLLGPALAPGFVLVRDLVWVPDLALTRNVVGLGSELPRAVPSDAVVAVLDEILPGSVLEKAVLVGALLLAAGGAMRLAGPGMVARLVAVSVTVWSPFVVERLWIGHWPVLLGYAAVPWLVVLGRRAVETGRVPAALYPVLLIGSLSANAGIVSATTLLAVGVRRSAGRSVAARLLLACAAANAPWVVSGLLHADSARAASGFEAFSIRGDGLPAPLAVLGLGGIWNADVVPASREGMLAWVALAMLLALAAAGLRPWATSCPRDHRIALVGLWLLGLLSALLGWGFPTVWDGLAGQVPGVALFRDGSRGLAWCLPLLVVLLAAGADRLVAGWRTAAPRLATAVVVVLAPIAVLPDAAWGGGQLAAVDYPAEWALARDALAADAAEQEAAGAVAGMVAVLPWSAYRAPAWNEHRAVLDPLPRYVRQDSVASGDLVVAGRIVPGEDPRAAAIAAALARPTPEERSAAMAALGVRWVATELDAGPAPDVVGTVLHQGETLRIVRLDGVAAQPPPGGPEVVAMALAWAAFAGVLLAPLWSRRGTRARRTG
ncbi:hypothetical protein [Nocardioides insulae]|uniref:hypothetical protein n=1 Tax=Nocardioides insulae TaxID=394734 RepID=UPI000416436A|nr:hypothetical protein [Nocardioides insulae]